jgi:hypothetical protein
MPRKKRAAGQSKAQMIRDFIKSHPKMRNVDIVAALAEQGVKVTPNYVSITKSKGRGKKRGRPGRRGRRGATARAMARSANGVGLDQMRDAARLIRSAGGIDGAREALAIAEHIAKALT